MKNHTSTDQVVSDLVATLLPHDSSIRQQHVLREALNGLVRLSKSEQMLEMKQNVRRLAGPFAETLQRSRLHMSGTGAGGGWQQQFEFMKSE